ncbi:Uncharacterised protein [uncultured Flavonifractor sp.]|nr:Uncharacterised protein [uncultured Flavonifractor sp.]
MSNLIISTKRQWSPDTVRLACIRNHLYTGGTCEEYSRMMEMVRTMVPMYENLYIVARDIKEHSNDQTITNVMFILEREAVITTFEIDGSDEI